MSDTPDATTGDAPDTGADDAVVEAPVTAAEDRRRRHDIWMSGTEAPTESGHFTGEGGQEMLGDEEGAVLAHQRGTLVSDDYLDDIEFDDEERQILNMGPQHPSTHGVLRLQIELIGERIVRAKPIIGYLHTGMEKTAETLTFMQGPTNVTRMDYLSPFFNELCFSLAVERLMDVEMPPRADAIRVLMTELNRVASHLVWAATQGMDIGALSMMIYGFRDREPILDFFEKTTGVRMNHNYIRPGGVAADLPDGWQADVEQIIAVVERGVSEYEGILNANPIFIERTQGVGVITPEECNAFGVTGPIARAAGVDWDLRKVFPYSGIDQYEFKVPLGRHGDTFDRYMVRIDEIKQSLGIVRQILDTMPDGDWRTEDRKVTPPPRARIDQSMEALIHHFKLFTGGFQVPAGEVYQAVESPRGELGMYMVSDGGPRPWRLHVRGPSFANTQALPVMLTDSLIADVVATLASADPVLGDVDR